jgi:uncharacterized membrane protein YbhN (UPF0104 family)
MVRRLAGAGIAAAAGLSLLLAVPSLRPVLEHVRDARPGWLLLAAALELASCASFVVVFRLCFDRVGVREARRLAWASMGSSVLLPGGSVAGLACGGWLMRRAGASPDWIARRSSALFFLTSACSAAAVPIGAALLPAGPHDLVRAAVPVAVAALAVAVVVALPRCAPRRDGLVGELAAGIREAERALARPTWRLLGAVGYLGFDIAVLWAAFRALGVSPQAGALMLGYLVGYLANAIPVPAGIAVLDGGLSAALVAYGAPAADAAAAVLLYHAIAFWLPALGGLYGYLRLRGGATDPVAPRLALAPA